MSLDKSKEIILQAALLRGRYKFQEAIDLIESNINIIDDDIKVAALIQAFDAAKEAGFADTAKKFAKKISIEEPDLPSIQKYLD